MFPTPEQLRAHAAHARQMSNEYRAEGNTAMADRRLSDAEFYEAQADFEELRIYRNSPPIIIGEAA